MHEQEGDQVSSDQEDAIDALLGIAREAELRLARFFYCDLAGVIRGKAAHADGLSDRLDEGIGLTTAQMAMNGLDQLQPIAGMSPVGEVRLMPDPESFTVLPYAPRTGAVFCDLLQLDHEPWWACPRSFLKRMLRRGQDMGVQIEAVFEIEYYLARRVGSDPHAPLEPIDDSLCFSATGMRNTAAFTDDLLGNLEAQNIQVEQVMPEYGPGQQELSIRHAPALQAADAYLLTRETIHAVAEEHGFVATFAPVPFPGNVGSGAHIHLSLWDTHSGENRFHDPAATHGFSDDGRSFVAGLLKHLAALTAMTCPSVNSYRRLRPSAWAGGFASWGFDNREASIRVPSTFWGREQGTTNIELKTVDHTCNPYLALGSVIAAGLEGMAANRDPGDALQVDPAGLTDAERERRGISPLPASLGNALEALKANDLLKAALGESLHTAYSTVRQSEVDHYRGQPDIVEYEDHRRRY